MVAAAGAIALESLGPPAPVAATAPVGQFSAERAMAHVRTLAREPHPAGSEANARARAYLVQQLTALGLAPEVVTAQIVDRRTAAEVRNVLVRIPGRTRGRAFAITAHYDSVRYGPGAADDIAGVAAMLEAARAITHSPPLNNDVLLIFTDAEEGGLLGAKAFARHPWAKEIGVLLGLEARGTRGPSLIFETSRDNGWLIRQLAAAGVAPRATSLAASIYERMPFNGDFSYLKKQGIPGFHAAFVGGFALYHTRDDNPEHLSLASLQHHGEYALGLARHFGNLPLDRVAAPDAVYFNALGSLLVHYPLSWGGPLAIAVVVLVGGILARGVRRGHLTLRGLMGGVVASAGIAAAAGAVVTLLLAVVFGPVRLVTLYRHRLTQLSDLGPFHHNELYGCAFALAAAAVVAALFRRWRGRVGVQNLAGGALLWWVALLVTLQVLLPGGSYLAAWPLLFAALQFLVLFGRPPAAEWPPGLITRLTPLVLPAVLLLIPTYRYLLASIMIITAPGLAMIPVLLAGLMLPQLDVLHRSFHGWPAGLTGGSALLLIVFGLANSGVSNARPGLDSVNYAIDQDAGHAFWLSSDEATDEWTAQFFPAGTQRAGVADFFPKHRGLCLRAPAPMTGFAGPQLRVVSDVATAGRRHLVLALDAPDRPEALEVHLLSDTQVFSAEVYGQPVSGARRGWDLEFRCFPPGGVTLTLDVAAAGPVRLRLISGRYGLAEIAGIRPRPAYLICEPNTVNKDRSIRSDQILVTRTFELPPPGSSTLQR